MIFVKLSVISWVLFFVIRFFVASQISNAEKLNIVITGRMKITPGRAITAIIFLISVALTVTSVIWFLFFSGTI